MYEAMPSTTGRRAGMLAIVIAFMSMILIAHSYRAAAKQRVALASFSSAIDLGMPRKEVDRICKRDCLENPGWKYYPSVEGLGPSVALVESPLTFGAKNWVVFIVFEDEVVAAVLVRTQDTRRLRPDEAPPDRVQDVRAPWMAEFTQDRASFVAP
jgi:hypothetical protein